MICPKCGLEVAENAVICIGCGTKTETFSEKKENQKDTEGEILGSTSCEHCGVRIRVPKTKQNLVGNIIKCPRCSEKFTLQMKDETKNKDSQSKNLKKREKDISENQAPKIQKALKKLIDRLNEIRKNKKSTEEDIRRWCIDLLREALGYKDGHIHTELKVLGKRVDIGLKKDNRVFMVIETKNVRRNLTDSIRDQAVGYAVGLGAVWSVITNGTNWNLYHIIPRRGVDPKIIEVFNIDLTDENENEFNSEQLSLLTSKSIFEGETEAEAHFMACTEFDRMFEALRRPNVLNSIKKEMISIHKEKYGIELSFPDEVVKDMVEDIFEDFFVSEEI